MLRADCSGDTRHALHIPSSSRAGKQNHQHLLLLFIILISIIVIVVFRVVVIFFSYDFYYCYCDIINIETTVVSVVITLDVASGKGGRGNLLSEVGLSSGPSASLLQAASLLLLLA